jgi:hypothetical protein
MQILTCLRHSGEACDELDVAEAISSQDTRLKQIFNITITTIFFWAFFMNVSSIIRERILRCNPRRVKYGATQEKRQCDNYSPLTNLLIMPPFNSEFYLGAQGIYVRGTV